MPRASFARARTASSPAVAGWYTKYQTGGRPGGAGGHQVSAVPQGAERGVHLNPDRTDHRQYRGRRGRGGVVARGQRVAIPEAGELPRTVPVVPAPAVQMQPQGRVQVQMVAGPGQGDVE